MSRRYHLYHLSDREKAETILKKARQIDGVKMISITDDLQVLDIETDAEVLSQVMDRVVNVCSRVSYGCEVSYMFS